MLHKTIDGVRADYDALRFNTAIARLIELNNALTKLDRVPRAVAEPLVLMMAPVAPHIAEELWARLGHAGTLAYVDFPVADPALLVDDTVTCVVQIQGKVRDRIEVAADVSDADLRAAGAGQPQGGGGAGRPDRPQGHRPRAEAGQHRRRLSAAR